MSLKSYMLVAAALLCAYVTTAQDKIYRKNGAVIEGKVLKIDIYSITYHPAETRVHTEATISKVLVRGIRYENGREERFDNQDKTLTQQAEPTAGLETAVKPYYGNNIVAIIPFQVSETGGYNSGGEYGFGLSYERILGASGTASFYLPATIQFSRSNVRTADVFTQYSFLPGIKIYPTGQGKLRYALGITAALIFGEENRNLWNERVSRTVVGAMVHNSINYCPTRFTYINANIGIGGGADLDQSYLGPNMLIQFGFTAGFRF